MRRLDQLVMQSNLAYATMPLTLEPEVELREDLRNRVPAVDPAFTLGSLSRSDAEDVVAVELDGAGNERRTLALPATVRLMAEVEGGFLVTGVEEEGLAVVDTEGNSRVLGSPDERLIDVQPTIAVGGRGWRLRIYSFPDGDVRDVKLPFEVSLVPRASLSPDGSLLPIDSSSPWTAPSRMCVVETASGATDFIEGEFDNFCYTPVWSALESGCSSVCPSRTRCSRSRARSVFSARCPSVDVRRCRSLTSQM
jgi:hypothetical protein